MYFFKIEKFRSNRREEGKEEEILVKTLIAFLLNYSYK